MFSETAELYDLIYGQFKKYSDESARIAALLREVHPEAERVLDVGCGTGEHARILIDEYGYEVDGLDLEPEFLRIAQRKCPRGEFHCADMLDFTLQKKYDAVLCLFSSIGYVLTLANVRLAFNRFRQHLAPGGVVIIEPWFEPAAWQPGTVFAHLVESNGIKVCRMSHSGVRDGSSVLEFQYLIGSARGVEHRREIHELGLFTSNEMKQALLDADLNLVQHDPAGLTERGLYVARRARSAGVSSSEKQVP